MRPIFRNEKLPYFLIRYSELRLSNPALTHPGLMIISRRMLLAAWFVTDAARSKGCNELFRRHHCCAWAKTVAWSGSEPRHRCGCPHAHPIANLRLLTTRRIHTCSRSYFIRWQLGASLQPICGADLQPLIKLAGSWTTSLVDDCRDAVQGHHVSCAPA